MTFQQAKFWHNRIAYYFCLLVCTLFVGLFFGPGCRGADNGSSGQPVSQQKEPKGEEAESGPHGRKLELDIIALDEALGTEVLLQVGESPILKVELKEGFMDLYRRPILGDDPKDVSRNTLEYILTRNYLHMEALRRELTIDPDLSRSWQARLPIWLGQLYQQKLYNDTNFDLEVIDLLVPQVNELEVSQIVVGELNQANLLLTRAEAGEDFGELARQHSIGPAAPSGGKLKDTLLTGGYTPYFEESVVDILEGVDTGDLSPVMKTGLGYGFFKVHDKKPLDEESMNTLKRLKTNELRLASRSQLRQQIMDLYPMEINEANLEKALTDRDGETVIATVGSYDIVFERFLSLFKDPSKVMLTDKQNLGHWKNALMDMHEPVAFYQEAVRQGMLKDKIVKKNLERVRKYSLVDTLERRFIQESEPSDEEVYQSYLQRYAGGGQEAIFSLKGVAGLSLADAEEISRRARETGELDLEKVKVLRGKVMEGTYRESDLDPGILMSLDMAVPGQATSALLLNGKYAVFMVTGKNRGEVPTLETVYAELKNELKLTNAQTLKTRIVIQWSREVPVQFIHDRKVVEGLIARWLDERKVASRLKSPHGDRGRVPIIPGDPSQGSSPH